MTTPRRPRGTGALLLLGLLAILPARAEAQARGGRDGGAAGVSAEILSDGVSLSVELRTQIRDYYAGRNPSDARGLPPGIRKNLARGKPIPPGIAKNYPPAELISRIHLHDGFELVEVGLDVFLVEVATNIIHDVLMDVIR